MKFLALSLLATSAAAIDLHLEFAGGCSTSGGGYICYNWNPDSCCSVNAGTFFNSGSFRAIPPQWNIQARGHAPPRCGTIRQQEDSRGRTYVCLGNGPFGGLGYGFNNRKMIRGETVEEEEETETECVQPNVMYLADGTQYNYTAIVEAKLDTVELNEIAKAGASAADIPESFEAFKIVQ
ncbi:hypothetical protein QC763_100110 [Podospora pseudopauciseta]|uniref:Secreted protein n=1 Tax=Podospora pseudopauciseta TaxID=2093780 RepID=A0ABR0HWB8_9PEZI|nr:hypothetical protein QC763_100110 [Podospora pseudopauciseta]